MLKMAVVTTWVRAAARETEAAIIVVCVCEESKNELK